MLLLINFLASLIIFSGSTWACFSKFICDGIFLKQGLIVVAFGAFANMVNPNGHAKLILICGIALMIAAIAYRWYFAKINQRKAVFINANLS